MADPKKLKKILARLSTPEERSDLNDASLEALNERFDSLSNMIGEALQHTSNTDIQDQLMALSGSMNKFRAQFGGFLNQLASSLEEQNNQVVKGFGTLSKVLTAKSQENPTAQWAGFFKDFPTMVTAITDSSESTKNTAEIIRNLKWNASQQLRDVNGSPINPSTAPFGITATYNDVKLTNYDGSGNVGTVTYFQNGNIVGQLQLSYDGSSNLTDVTRSM